ncbi:MAG: metallophosphoesterase [Oscillospiraceae bacterium]|jgi:hypothetical protein|nr:metallophosphoesterase [Oscillospiraceae bacterium]
MKYTLWQYTDLHLWYRADGTPPPAADQLDYPHCKELIAAGLKRFAETPEVNALLLTGDLTEGGYPEEHDCMLEMLRRTQNAVAAQGKRIIVLTASHDARRTSDDELRTRYAPYGIEGALAVCNGGQAFVVQLAPGLRLLCINDHGNDPPPPWLPWAIEQVQAAKTAGEIILGATHRPTLPPSPIYPGEIAAWPAVADTLSRAGLRLMLSGHSHMHSITYKTKDLYMVLTGDDKEPRPLKTEEAAGPLGIGRSTSGYDADGIAYQCDANIAKQHRRTDIDCTYPYCDVNTGAFTGFPGKFRQICIADGTANITSLDVPYIPAFGALSSVAYLKGLFTALLNRIFDGLVGDYEVFVQNIRMVGVRPDQARKGRKYYRLGGWFLHHMTLGSLGRLLWCRIPKRVRKLRLRDAVQPLIRSIFSGNTADCNPETDLGKALLAIAGQMDKLPLIGDALADAADLIQLLVHNPTPDHAAAVAL